MLDESDGFVAVLKRLAIHRDEDIAVFKPSFVGGTALDDRSQLDVVGFWADADLTQSAALKPLSFRSFKFGHKLQRRRCSGALDGELDLLAFAQDDALGDAIERPGEAVHRVAIDRDDLVARNDPGDGGRTIRQNFDDLSGNEIRRFSHAIHHHRRE